MEGFMQRLAEAKGAIQRNAIAEKGEAIGKAIAIVGGLRGSLNSEVGGDLTKNLDALYEYLEHRLLEANLNSSTAILDEALQLMKTLKSGWDGIDQHAA